MSYETLKHFRLVGTFNPEPLQQAVLENAERFGDLTFRQETPGSAHPDTETIYLRLPPEISVDAVFNSVEEVNYPAWQIEAFRNLCLSIAQSEGAELGRAMVIKLKPGGVISGHIDDGYYANNSERYHAVIASNPKAWLRANDEKLSMPPGSVWWFDKHVWHDGANMGDTDRIHLVLDLYHANVPGRNI
ncbi:hypothetical protein GAY31_11450 [Azospirillum brasilense]|nr:hypothetical protein [Azospirillum brasilense]